VDGIIYMNLVSSECGTAQTEVARVVKEVTN